MSVGLPKSIWRRYGNCLPLRHRRNHSCFDLTNGLTNCGEINLTLCRECGKLPGHMMRTGAGLHYDSAGVGRREEFDQLFAPQLFAKHGLTFSISPMKVEAMLAQIDTNDGRVVHDGLQFGLNAPSVT